MRKLLELARMLKPRRPKYIASAPAWRAACRLVQLPAGAISSGLLAGFMRVCDKIGSLENVTADYSTITLVPILTLEKTVGMVPLGPRMQAWEAR